MMGHIERREREGGVVWRARYRDPAGRERSRSFRRKIEAERFLTQTEAALHHGDWTDPDLGRTTVRAWAPQWLRTKRGLKPKTLSSYQSLLRSRVLPALGDTPLAKLDRARVEAWVSDLEAHGLSASRIRQAFNVLAAMLDAAVANRMITRNVARGIELPRIPKTERRFLTEAQVMRLADAAPLEHRALILVLAYSGIRWGEAVALRRGRCDLLRRRLHILEAAVEVDGHLSWGTPKTHRQRSVSIPAFVCDDLAEHLVGAPMNPDELVFHASTGGPLRHGDFIRYVWRPAVRAGGLPEGLTPHELRHTAASLLIAQGAGPKVDPGAARTLDDHDDVRHVRAPVRGAPRRGHGPARSTVAGHAGGRGRRPGSAGRPRPEGLPWTENRMRMTAIPDSLTIRLHGGKDMSGRVDDLLDALDRVGAEPGRPVSAHLDPALNDAAKAAVALGLATSVSGLTGQALLTELRRLALRAALDAHYTDQPGDRPDVAEVAAFLARARRLQIADREDLADVLATVRDAMGPDVDAESLLAATAAHLTITGSAA
jgi:integrase